MRTLFAILFFALLAALLALTYYPDLPDLKVQIKDEWFRLDYIGHLGFYAAVTATFLSWRAGWRMKIPRLLLILTIIGGSLLGIVTEISQLAIHGRSFNPIDMVFNCAGVLIGVVVMVVVGWKDGKGVRGKVVRWSGGTLEQLKSDEG